MSQPKVFEFAKEIGMETLALMDKIREWKLPVRSHMAELEHEVLEQIKTLLKAPPAEAPAKKKAAKKATPAKAKAADDEGAAKKAPAKKVVAKKAAAKAAPAAEAAELAARKAPAKIVVRRKADEEVAAAAAAPAPVEEPIDETPVAQAASPAVAPTPVAAPVAPPAPAVAAPAPVARIITPAPVAAPAPPPVAVTPAAPVATAPAQAAAPAASAPTDISAAAPAAAPTPAAGPAPARKREVVMTSQGPVSGVRSEAPRRNIVGRMDLSRVTPPPGSSFSPGGRPGMPPRSGGGASAPARTGGPIGGGGLRTGFVAAAPMPTEETGNFERRRFDDKKKRGPGAPGAASPTGGLNAREKEAEEQLASFSATEFRKREMVFQPKKKKGMLSRDSKQTSITTPKASKRVVRVNSTIKVSDLAMEMGLKAAQLIKALIGQGVMATMNTVLDFDTVALIVPDFGFEATNVFKSVDQMIENTAFGNLTAATIVRPPVVTIMGHVDHGKTSLLDVIRKANVAKGEAGGITQHIGAYQVKTEDGHLITFLDTPGHEAFTAMRARGANATDIVVIVIAADDGVMPQTAEAVNHAKASGVPIIVAMNKMDKPGANPERIKQQLTEFELVPEEWGGTTIFVPVSAHTKEGIPELLEQIYLTAEVEELKANPERSATGVVIEARMDKGRGAVATLLVQDGTLKVGQAIVVGSVAGRVRSLINDKGERIKEAGPSVPVEVLGLSSVPMAGDRFDAAENEQAAAKIASTRRDDTEKAEIAVSSKKLSLEDIFSKMKQGNLKELPIILKTDVAGSAEAIKGMFEKIGTSEVKIKIVHSAVGGINESDVLLANTAKGIVVGFNVRPDTGASAMAKRQGVDVKTYSVVYELMNDMKKAMSGLLTPNIVESQLGHAEVRNMFTVPKIGTIAGCFVQDGKITRQSQVRLVRDGKIIYSGKISSLKRFKDDAREVSSGYECGIGIENYNDLKVGDVIEAYSQESVSREL